MYGNSYSCIRQCVKKGNKIKYIGLFFDCISPSKPLREERILLHVIFFTIKYYMNNTCVCLLSDNENKPMSMKEFQLS